MWGLALSSAVKNETAKETETDNVTCLVKFLKCAKVASLVHTQPPRHMCEVEDYNHFAK
jgi:hypothetical protein